MTELAFILLLLVVAYWTGSWIERRHYRSILAREARLMSLPAVASRMVPEARYRHELVMGNVTVSVDYFKRMLSALHWVFGGNVTSYETLLDRARREALLRLKEMAAGQGASLVLNVKYETASVSKGVGDTIGSVEVLAYGTAMIADTDEVQQ